MCTSFLFLKICISPTRECDINYFCVLKRPLCHQIIISIILWTLNLCHKCYKWLRLTVGKKQTNKLGYRMACMTSRIVNIKYVGRLFCCLKYNLCKGPRSQKMLKSWDMSVQSNLALWLFYGTVLILTSCTKLNCWKPHSLWWTHHLIWHLHVTVFL